ncbi:unnamed protein product [Clonostachys rosea]|uniref:Peptidase S8/S53 domain-containing protein n=1 Tax=Bionectria ochroleuca TaxID=29856 RepID=A0ABY6V038_BIOOC|nr:unnamed protein product [Clonostachys rosea]
MVQWSDVLRAAAIGAAALMSGANAWNKESIMASGRPSNSLGAGQVPGRYIVELEIGAGLHQREIQRRADAVLSSLSDVGLDVDVKDDYSAISTRFSGLSIEVKNSKEGTLDQLKKVEGVADAWPVYTVKLNPIAEGDGSKRAWNPHIVTRVDELHKRGINGQGQRVCVVDSGVDVAHPALAGRIVGGKNMLDDNNDVQDCIGHGTFVSSVIVGDTKDFHGVAPQAEVYMYKVFPCSDSTSNDIILKGMLAADADNCDIISLSLGSDSGYHGSVLSTVASSIAQDRLVVVAAGNSGEQGIFYASSPASGRGVLSVASVNARQVLRWPATVRSSSGQELAISYITADGTKVNETVNAPITFDAGDACNPDSYGDESQALVIQRGVCMWAKTYNTLMYNGFGYYLIFDSYNQGVFYPSDALNSNPSIHLFGLTAASVGAWVREETAAGHNLTLVIKPDDDPAASDPANTFNDFPGSGQVSYFSSWGPTFENDFSPKIAGPGGFVYGAHPDNKYVVQSGTSFSTPYIAGVAALFYAHVKKDSKEFLRRISATAATLPAWDEREKSVLADIAPLAQQGSGIVDAVKVMDYQTILLSDSHISLNDTDNRVSTHKIRLANTGSSQVTYKISHVAAASVKSRDEYLYPYTYMPPLTAASGSIRAPNSITIAPGSTQDVEVTFNKPANDQENSGTVWSGKVVFEGTNGEFVSVPYMGVEVSTYNWTPLEGSPLFFRYDSGSGYLYPIDWQSKPYKLAESDSPEVYYALRYGTYEFSFDLVGHDWKVQDFSYPLVSGSGSAQWLGSLRSAPDVFGSYVEFPARFPLRFSNVGFTRFQSFANGTAVRTGRYRILARALRVFGDAKDAKDWQFTLSDAFTVQLGDEPLPSTPISSTTAVSTPLSTATPTSQSMSTTSSQVIVTPSSSAIASTTAVPGITTTLRAIAAPTGVPDAIVDVSVAKQGVSTNQINDPGVWLELHVRFEIPTRLPLDSSVSFALPPQIVDVATSNYVMDQSSNLVGSASFDKSTSLYTINFGEYVTWHSQFVGDFYLFCRFSEDYRPQMQAGTYYLEILTVGKSIYTPLTYTAVDRTRVYEHIAVKKVDNLDTYEFKVEVPGQLGPWNSVTFTSAYNENDGFLCTETAVSVGTEFNALNQVTQSRDITAASVKRCEVKNFRAIVIDTVAAGEALVFSIATLMGVRESWSITMTYNLAIELKNGTTIGWNSRTMTYEKNSRSRPDNWISAVVDRDGPIGPIISTTSLILTISTPVSTPASTPVSSSTATTPASTPGSSTQISSSIPQFSTVSSGTSIGSSSSAVETSTPVSTTPVSSTAISSTTPASSTIVTSTTPISSGASVSSSVPASSTPVSSTTLISSTTPASSTPGSSSAVPGSQTTSGSSTTPISSHVSSSVIPSSQTMPVSSTTPISLTNARSSTTDVSASVSLSISQTAPGTAISSASVTTHGSTASSSTISATESSPAGISNSVPASSISSPSSPLSGTSVPTSASNVALSSSSRGPVSHSGNLHSSGGSSYPTAGPSEVTRTSVKQSLAPAETQTVTVITSVCSDPSWTAPVTVTITVPCATSGQTKVTTITSVCTRCADHPVTVTYTQPAAQPTSTKVDGFRVPSSASQVPNLIPHVTISTGLGKPGNPAYPSAFSTLTSISSAKVSEGAGQGNGGKSSQSSQPSGATVDNRNNSVSQIGATQPALTQKTATSVALGVPSTISTSAPVSAATHISIRYLVASIIAGFATWTLIV